jgi:predicted HicB family RNase H-like nuclease
MKKLTIRVPDELHEQLLAYAKSQHRSLQAQLLALIEEALRRGAIPKRNPSRSS